MIIAKYQLGSELVSHSTDNNLHLAYVKYKAAQDMQEQIAAEIANKTWEDRKPSIQDVFECFTSKTMWYSKYEKAFSLLHTYEKMKAWLEREPLTAEELDDEDLVESYQDDTKEAWGYWKDTKFGFADLIRWIDAAEKEKKRVAAEA